VCATSEPAASVGTLEGAVSVSSGTSGDSVSGGGSTVVGGAVGPAEVVEFLETDHMVELGVGV